MRRLNGTVLAREPFLKNQLTRATDDSSTGNVASRDLRRCVLACCRNRMFDGSR